MLRVFLGQPLHLVVEREQFAGLGAVHLDGIALAGQLGHVDFALAFGGEISARAHGKRRGDEAGEAGQQHILAVAGGCAADAADDAEDGAQAVVDAVDGVSDPASGLLAALVALGQHLIEHRLGVDFLRAGRSLIVAAQERPKFAVVVLLVLDDVFEDGDGFLIAQRLQLFAVAGDGAALFDLQTAQGHAHAAGAVGQRVGLAAGAAPIDRLAAAQLDDASMPERGVLPLGASQMAQHLGAHRVRVPVGQGHGRCGSPPSQPASCLPAPPGPSSAWRCSTLHWP